MILVATAGWSIPRACASAFPGAGSHLQRYAARLRGVEINTSFYREHLEQTYARWAAQVPAGFLFALNLPRQVTHDQRLRAARRPLEAFLKATSALGRHRGPLVMQLPPSLPFEPRVARNFLALLRDRHDGHVVCEPRHPGWFTAAADALLMQHRIARVAADPAVVPPAARPGGWPGVLYCRLHGSPRKYWSAYGTQELEHWADVLSAPRATPAWCVFDNTASGAAMANALQMLDRVSPPARGSSRGSRPGSAAKPAAARHK